MTVDRRRDSPTVVPSTPRLEPIPLVARLAAYGERPAFVGPEVDGAALSYAGLAERVEGVAASLGTARRLVLVRGGNNVECLVAYLGAMAAGHPILLAGDDSADTLVAAYDPDVVHGRDGFTIRHDVSAHDLHPDLALLLTTSGSTGSPKLVRLSTRNLVSNAAAIASYLALRPGDVAATTLPMHYCYGLSVVHSHLYAGAGLMLTSLSVLEPAFWDAFRAHRATSFAGVPYTFELLDQIGFAGIDLPHLRYVTQAGGRLAPDDVRRLVELGQRRGFDFYVMYGQTEATARMAYLPPTLAHAAPSSIGLPIPGGSFTLEPLPDLPLTRENGEPTEVGELVFHGPNVMLGYAECPADLARGRTVTALRTGDVARIRSDGLYEVLGRRSRIAKVFGIRIDLDHVERVLATRGVVASAADGGKRLVLAVCDGAAPVDSSAMSELVHREFGLPAAGFALLVLSEIPRLPSGKTDYRAIVAMVGQVSTDPDAGGPGPAATAGAVRRLYAELLGRTDAQATDSFVSLGGDSLSYVEVSLRLERLIGHLPPNWHTMPIAALVDAAVERRRGVVLETNVLLRSLAIVSIVATHANLFVLLGGAHVLLAVVGFNYGRFQVTAAPRTERLHNTLRSVARIAVPSAAVIGAFALWTDGLGWPQALLVNSLASESWTEPAWHYWFIEALVHTLLLVGLLLVVPLMDRVERRWPFWLPFGLALAGLLTRFEVIDPRGGDDIHRSHVLFWLFALGWATAKARTRLHRFALSGLVLATVPGFSDDLARDGYIALGMLALIWVPQVRVPRAAARVSGVLAAASLWIYLVHWQVYPNLEQHLPLLATLLALAGGVVAWQVDVRLRSSWRRATTQDRTGATSYWRALQPQSVL